MGEPSLSVVIATYRRDEPLVRCLQSLGAARPPHGGHEIIVVDDGGGMARAALARAGVAAELIELPANRGQPCAQWIGARRARAGTLAFLDDDAVVAPDWMTQILDFFAAAPGAAAVVGRVEALRLDHILARTRQQIYDVRDRRYRDAGGLASHVSGGNFAIHRDALLEVGGFPIGLPLGADDELSLRLLRAGKTIGYNPSMSIRHEHNESFVRLFRQNFREGRDMQRCQPRRKRAARLAGAIGGLIGAPLRTLSRPELRSLHAGRIRAWAVFSSVEAMQALGRLRELFVATREEAAPAHGPITPAARFLNELVTVQIDRPIGSHHPKTGLHYPVNYGFVPGTRGGDDEELDAYVLGPADPLDTFRGRCVAVIRRLNDVEDKLVVAPDGAAVDDQEIRTATFFQEQYFEIEIQRSPIVPGSPAAPGPDEQKT